MRAGALPVCLVVLFLVRCSPAPVLGVGLFLAAEHDLPPLAVGSREDPALGDDVAKLGGVHEAHHAVAGAKGEALGVRTGPLESLHALGLAPCAAVKIPGRNVHGRKGRGFAPRANR